GVVLDEVGEVRAAAVDHLEPQRRLEVDAFGEPPRHSRLSDAGDIVGHALPPVLPQRRQATRTLRAERGDEGRSGWTIALMARSQVTGGTGSPTPTNGRSGGPTTSSPGAGGARRRRSCSSSPIWSRVHACCPSAAAAVRI